MSEGLDIPKLQDLLATPKEVVILFGPRSGVDEVASALALYLTLKEVGHSVTVASNVELRAEFSRLVGLDEVRSEISNRDLVISFPGYDFSSIEKVTHNDGHNNAFELVIQPKAGHKAPDDKQVTFRHQGASAELVFTFAVPKLDDLGVIYEQERNLFHNTQIVALLTKGSCDYTGAIMRDEAATSMAELTLTLVENLGLNLHTDAATNLLSGIDHTTNRFASPKVNASTFMAAAKLMQSGAKRQPPRMSMPPAQVGNMPPGFMPFVPPSSVNRLPGAGATDMNQPPADWLTPKIYKGGTQV